MLGRASHQPQHLHPGQPAEWAYESPVATEGPRASRIGGLDPCLGGDQGAVAANLVELKAPNCPGISRRVEGDELVGLEFDESAVSYPERPIRPRTSSSGGLSLRILKPMLWNSSSPVALLRPLQANRTRMSGDRRRLKRCSSLHTRAGGAPIVFWCRLSVCSADMYRSNTSIPFGSWKAEYQNRRCVLCPGDGRFPSPEKERAMYEYRVVKSIHDQRMRQFMIEAERAHLLRQLRQNRSHRAGLVERVMVRIREALETVPATARYSRLSA